MGTTAETLEAEMRCAMAAATRQETRDVTMECGDDGGEGRRRRRMILKLWNAQLRVPGRRKRCPIFWWGSLRPSTQIDAPSTERSPLKKVETSKRRKLCRKVHPEVPGRRKCRPKF